MPRQLRIEYPGAIYHVMNRGNGREKIFLDAADRELFLSMLGKACGKTEPAGTRRWSWKAAAMVICEQCAITCISIP